jgi:hypothetical protein
MKIIRGWGALLICLVGCPGTDGMASDSESGDESSETDCGEACSASDDASDDVSEPATGVCVTTWECVERFGSESECNGIGGQHRDLDTCLEADHLFYCAESDSYYEHDFACETYCADDSCDEVGGPSGSEGPSNSGSGWSTQCGGVSICINQSAVIEQADGSTTELRECHDDWQQSDCTTVGGDWLSGMTCKGAEFPFFCSDGRFYESEQLCIDYGSAIDDHTYEPPPGREACDRAVNRFSCMYPDIAGDGHCDFAANDADCNWDGGDCCEQTCVSTASSTCGAGGFSCADPSVAGSTGEPTDSGAGTGGAGGEGGTDGGTVSDDCLVGTYTAMSQQIFNGGGSAWVSNTLSFEASGEGRLEVGIGSPNCSWATPQVSAFQWEVAEQPIGAEPGRVVFTSIQQDNPDCYQPDLSYSMETVYFRCDDSSATFSPMEGRTLSEALEDSSIWFRGTLYEVTWLR